MGFSDSCDESGFQTQTCTDLNSCGTTSGKPAESQVCLRDTDGNVCNSVSTCSTAYDCQRYSRTDTCIIGTCTPGTVNYPIDNSCTNLCPTGGTCSGDSCLPPCGSDADSSTNCWPSSCSSFSSCSSTSACTCSSGYACTGACPTCSTSSVESITCPTGEVVVGAQFTIDYTYKDSGSNSAYDYEHRSYHRLRTGETGYENEWDGCQRSRGNDDCSIKSDSFSGEYPPTAPSTPGVYTYIVKSYAWSSEDNARCGRSEGSTQSCTVNVVNPAPSKPALSSPDNGATGVSTTPTLDWSDTVSAGGWYFLYYKKSTDASYTRTLSQLTSSQHTLSALPYNTVYNWYAEACNTGPKCTNSDTWSFTTQACTGSVILTLNPQTVESGKTVTPSASGLSNCAGKTVYFKQDSCSGTEVSSCAISSPGTGCSGNAFTSSGSPGEYTYFACIDKNGDSDFND